MRSLHRTFWFMLLVIKSTSVLALQNSEDTFLDNALIEMASAKSFVEYTELQQKVILMNPAPINRDSAASNRMPLSIDVVRSWKTTVEKLREGKKRNRGDRYSIAVWHEFFGYLNGKFDMPAPEEWKYYAVNRRLPESSDGISLRLSEVDQTVFFEVDGFSFRVRAGSIITTGEVERLGNGETPGWKTSLFRLIRTDAMITGSPSFTILANFGHKKESGELFYWGVHNDGICFVNIIDLEDGNIIDRAFFDLQELD